VKNKKAVLIAVFIVLFLIVCFFSGTLGASAQPASSCEKCHTNETVLKASYTPAKQEGAAAEEGEG
jgi:hypothetical protein